MKIATPKKISEIIASYQSSPEKLAFLPTMKATDEKGRYLHWDKLRRVYPKESELYWLATKMSRASLMTNVTIFNRTFSFCVPSSLLALLHFIDKNAGGLMETGLSKTEQNRFLLKSLIMEESISSAQLEGAATTRKVAKEMLETARKPRTKDEMMIVNNYKLMQQAVNVKNDPLSIELILSLHQTATHQAIENNAISGAFRADDEIYIADYDGNNIHQPPSHQELPQLMSALCEFANTEHDGDNAPFIHPIVKGIILHFLIGYIHPFGDGNGRTARALFYWFMLKNNYWLFEYISISRLLKKAPVKYAKAYIYTETDELDMTYFIYYQAEIIKRANNDLASYVHDKQKHFREFSAIIANYTAKLNPTLNQRQIKILQKAVKEIGYIFTVKEISNEYGVSENTARKDLNHLLSLHLLGQLKTGKTVGYISPNNLLEQLQRA